MWVFLPRLKRGDVDAAPAFNQFSVERKDRYPGDDGLEAIPMARIKERTENG